MFLQVNNLSKRYASKLVLENISFSQEKGEIISLIGTSGIGKSTLLKCIAGLCDINSGDIILNNNNIDSLEANNRKISYVFQESPLFPHINVLDNILFNMSTYDNQKLDFLLEKTELKSLVKRFPFELSGGENQRAAVVRSLIRNPDLLLLDEPFSNLDTVNKKYVKEIVFDIIKESNLTTIIVNHDIEESLEISDKIMIINDGKIDAIDTPENIYNHPKNLSTAQLFGDVTSLAIQNKKRYIRPENIKIVEKSIYDIEVNNSFYLGEKYRISAKLGSDIINLYHNTNIKKGSKLFIDFNEEDILGF
mgnify:FL=1|tara:strand:+ start:128 stop:1048 length:921 start_codon:yes stop_codon:yes gene_type:complete